jgi:hypothetical protein
MQVDVAEWEESEALRLAATAVEAEALRLAATAVAAEAIHLVATIQVDVTVLEQCSLALQFPTERFSQYLVIQFSTRMCL